MNTVIKFSILIAASLGCSLASAAAPMTVKGYASGEAPCPYKEARDAHKISQAKVVAQIDAALGESTPVKYVPKNDGRVTR